MGHPPGQPLPAAARTDLIRATRKDLVRIDNPLKIDGRSPARAAQGPAAKTLPPDRDRAP
jgi:hypothetical protein